LRRKKFMGKKGGQAILKRELVKKRLPPGEGKTFKKTKEELAGERQQIY